MARILVKGVSLMLGLGWATPCTLAQEAPSESPVSQIPSVTDPQLAPPPRPSELVSSWDQALALIRTRSTDYRSAAQLIARAEAQKRVALAAVLPTVLGNASYAHNFLTTHLNFSGTSFVSPPQNVLSLGATANWPIVNPRGLYAVATADRAIDAARATFEDNRRQIAVAAVDAFLATLAAERIAELNRVGLRTALERLVLTQTRLQFAKGTPLDVDRAMQDVANARGTLIRGDESLRQARETLGQLLGSREPLGAPGDLDLRGFERAVARTCRLNRDLEQRPDVVSARIRLELAERQMRDAELQTSPVLSVQAQAGHVSAVTLGPRTTVSVGGVLAVPFYDGGARYGALRDAKALAEQSRQALEAARINAIVSAARAARSVEVFQSSRDVARAERDLAASVDARTRNGYMQGVGTSLDLVTSAQALRQSEINLALLEFQVAQARANAYLVNSECIY